MDGSIQIQFAGNRPLDFAVQVKTSLTQAGAQELGNGLVALEENPPAPGLRRMVVSPYIAPPAQRALRERGIAYCDATGNLFIASSDPFMLVVDRGASADPWRGPGRPSTNLKGLPAALLVRALVDFEPPYSVPQLANAAGASVGAAYRLIDYLNAQGLLTYAVRGPISDVAWPPLLRQWSQEASPQDPRNTQSYLEPRGLEALMSKLRDKAEPSRCVVGGSLAAQANAPYAEPRLALLYTEDPQSLAESLGLRPVAGGANVIVAAPRSPVVFERTVEFRGVETVAPSQAVADLLNGPGRNPAEGEYLLDWMEGNTNEWRRQLDR
ncbi:MAG: hypothetical protein WAV45_02855 [Propionibacteriaceae bacterium]